MRHKTLILRIFFISSLLAAAVLCGSVGFLRIRDLEEELGQQTYESVAQRALQGARSIAQRKIKGADVLKSFFSYGFPNATQWPLVALEGYVDMAGEVAELTNTFSHSFNVILTPDEIGPFEEFARRTYQSHGYPETAGVSDFGFGVWSRSNETEYEDGRVHDTTGATSWGGRYNISTPIFQHNNISANSLMYNSYSAAFTGGAIDSMLECAKLVPSSQQCAVTTDLLELITRPGPAALLFRPISPVYDPNTIVGMIGTTLHWAEVLTNVVPNYVDGLICVVSNEHESITYNIARGQPEFLGYGDIHESEYEAYAHSIVLNEGTNASASVVYTLTVYPSELIFNEFRTNSPLAVSLGFVAVLIFCTALFFLYDFFMQYESHERKVVLELKRRFVRFVSHEIRTPLNTVCLGLELLQCELCEDSGAKDAMDADLHETKALVHLGENVAKKHAKVAEIRYWLDLTNDIYENSSNAVMILNDLLNYDKIETRSFKLEIGVVDILSLIATTVSSFRIQATKHSTKLKVFFRDDQGNEWNMADATDELNQKDRQNLRAIGDDARLRQVIRNLISNALKFSPESEGSITVETRLMPHGLPNAVVLQPKDGGDLTSAELDTTCLSRHGSIQLSVTDNGVGLTAEQLTHLFEEGVQFDANKLQHGGGSGLGLYITKGLVEQHGGTIAVKSEGINKGTTFTVELPLYDVPDTERVSSTFTDVVNYGSECSSHSFMPERNHRVLVVDDVLSNRKMLVRLLERAGHTCCTACNGQEAVEAVAADRTMAKSDPGHVAFDTILMDYEMPILNGPEAAKQVRDQGCSVFIIGVTGNVLSEDVAYFKNMGANDVLPKPVSMSLLDEIWRKATRKNQTCTTVL